MVRDVPFDVWNGEDLATAEVLDDDAPEELAMHLDLGEPTLGERWSEMIEGSEVSEAELRDTRPVSYFSDEQPDSAEGNGLRKSLRENPEPDLEQMLERQHYAFPRDSGD